MLSGIQFNQCHIPDYLLGNDKNGMIHKKIPSLRRRLGTNSDGINPHRILAPKIVRETSMQVFWLSLPCRPSQLMINQWLASAEALTLSFQGRDHSGGSAPDWHGIPFAWTVPIQLCRPYTMMSVQSQLRVGICYGTRRRVFAACK